MITVVNKRRAPLRAGVARIYVGRPSPLGNPFAIGRDGTREEVIEKYRAWLGTTDAALDELIRIRAIPGDIELECWCAPAACHADVIKAALEEWPVIDRRAP